MNSKRRELVDGLDCSSLRFDAFRDITSYCPSSQCQHILIQRLSRFHFRESRERMCMFNQLNYRKFVGSRDLSFRYIANM